ncbi:MAG: decarboxylating NADP(+)-dependent phosphogluconate dehydrogenase, partial [Pirellulaceae bacterium]
MTSLCDIGLCGLKVMGQNLVLNMEDHGYRVAVWNRTTATMQEFVATEGAGRKLVGCETLAELVRQLKSPRIVMLMVEAGGPVDSVIDQLVPLLSSGDVIMDGGNSYFKDTERRTKSLEQQGLLFIGTGVSGGEEGARHGPSIMPGGSEKAWPLVKPILQAISAKVGPHQDIPCCDWVGPRGAGHYVKMVHNGIEYGDMQLICEAYAMLKLAAGLSNTQLYDVFAQWNGGELQSYLIEITRDIFSVRDELAEGDLVDKILDRAGAKGTGKWMSQDALDLGMPSTLVTTAVYARSLSAQKDARVRASQLLSGAAVSDAERDRLIGERTPFIEKVRQALYASKIVSYAQGFVQLQAAAREYAWPLDYGLCARLWRGGCIIRAQFLERIMEAFGAEPALENLLLFEYFQDAVATADAAWRDVVVVTTRLGI